MDIELIQQIVDYIRTLAEPLVTTGYDLVLKQVQYIMVRDIVFTSLVIVAMIGAWFVLRKIYNDFDETSAIFLGMIVYCISLGIVGANISSILNALINPDWVAIQMIMSLVK